MNVITLDAPDAWDAYVMNCPRTVAWQLSSWHHAVGRNYPMDFLPLAAMDGPRVVGVLPLYQFKGRDTPSQLYSVPYAVAGGLSADTPEAEAALLAAAIAIAVRRQAPGITLKQYKYPVTGALRTDGNFFNRELNLQLGRDRLWNQFDERNCSRLECANRWEVTVDFPSQRLDVFYRLLLRHLQRQGVPAPARAWVQSLVDLGLYSIALLEHDGRICAGTMVKAFKSTVSFPYTCLADGSEESLTAAYVLYWELIQRFSRDHYEIFHSGRMPQNEDVDIYRRGWGGEKHPYYYQYYPETQERTEFRTKRGWKRRLMSTGWKFLPAKIAERLGPRIVAKFP